MARPAHERLEVARVAVAEDRVAQVRERLRSCRAAAAVAQWGRRGRGDQRARERERVVGRHAEAARRHDDEVARVGERREVVELVRLDRGADRHRGPRCAVERAGDRHGVHLGAAPLAERAERDCRREGRRRRVAARGATAPSERATPSQRRAAGSKHRVYMCGCVRVYVCVSMRPRPAISLPVCVLRSVANRDDRCAMMT